MRIHGVHGIWTDGNNNVNRLLWWLGGRYGYATREVTLPRRNPFSARFRSAGDAEILLSEVEDGDVAIGHSYGCAVVAKAMESARFSSVFLFRPAMERGFVFPKRGTEIHCIHSHGDWAIFLGMLLRFGHPFGSAGRTGFDDLQVTNIRARGGHSADFSEKQIPFWGGYVHDRIRAKPQPNRIWYGRE